MILGIVGSPRKNGRTSEMIDAALQGAASVGSDTQKVYLADYEIRPFLSQGGAEDGVRFVPAALSALCTEADGLVLGAPVYFGEINGLTKDFMDSVRIRNENGKPALGTAVAGGSGKGLFSGVQSIMHWFYHRQMRATEPVPVTRFSWDTALAELERQGGRLAEMARDVQPFPGRGREDRWADVLAYYAAQPYFDLGPVDEFMTLAQHLLATSSSECLEEARRLYDQALHLLRQGRRAEAGRLAVAVYDMLYH